MTNYKADLHNINTLILDYDGVLTNGIVQISAQGELLRSANVKDGYAIHQAVKKGLRVVVITGADSNAIKYRMKALGVTDVFIGVKRKLQVYESYKEKMNITDNQIFYMGDDIPDIPCMKLAGLAACPMDAAEEVVAISDFVSHFKGGEGCVREVIEQILKIQNKWMDKEAYEW